MEFFSGDFLALSNPGVTSVQLISPHNSQSSRVTITRVTVQPGAGQPRHHHKTSEQIWIALSGTAFLLLADDATRTMNEGDVARFADGDIHGVENRGSAPFIYLAVTSPPIDFDYAYASARS
jgi:quercetin dioxygenase-like cupin family protein